MGQRNCSYSVQWPKRIYILSYCINEINSLLVKTTLELHIPKTNLSLISLLSSCNNIPDSKVHGAITGPTWVMSAQGGPCIAPWTLPSGMGPMSTMTQPKQNGIRWALFILSQTSAAATLTFCSGCVISFQNMSMTSLFIHAEIIVKPY